MVTAGSQLSLVATALTALRDAGKLIDPSLNVLPPAPPTVNKRNADKELTKNHSSVNPAEDRLDQLTAHGFVLIFTDGFSEKDTTVGDIAGHVA